MLIVMFKEKYGNKRLECPGVGGGGLPHDTINKGKKKID